MGFQKTAEGPHVALRGFISPYKALQSFIRPYKSLLDLVKPYKGFLRGVKLQRDPRRPLASLYVEGHKSL